MGGCVLTGQEFYMFTVGSCGHGNKEAIVCTLLIVFVCVCVGLCVAVCVGSANGLHNVLLHSAVLLHPAGRKSRTCSPTY